MIEAGRVLPPRGMPRWELALAVAAAVLVGTAGGVVLHRLHGTAAQGAPPAIGLPELHGQAAWAVGERPAPAFSLPDERGTVVSLRALRGQPVLLAFLGARCLGGCAVGARRLTSVLRRLPAAERPTVLVVSVDPERDTPAAIDSSVRRMGLSGAWRWHWLTAGRARLAPVWRAYGAGARPSLFLIDRRGDERTAYLFPFLPAFVEGDLARLAGEHG